MAVELVYFNIHARGELTRLCYAAAGRSDELKDTRIPLFMESAQNAEEWKTIHAPQTPFGYLPYLKVETNSGAFREISGDGTVETFVAQRLGLLGNDDIDGGICSTIALRAVGLLGPQLTRAGLTGQEESIRMSVEPAGAIGKVFEQLERYVGKLKGVDSAKGLKNQPEDEELPFYIVSDKITLADLAIFNSVDECIKGPRSQENFSSVENLLRKEYPLLMRTYDQVDKDLSKYIKNRQSKFI